jgi:hypothetical protein
MKYKIITAIIYCLFWYLIALWNARDCDDEKKYLGITESQWTAWVMLCIPILLLFKE